MRPEIVGVPPDGPDGDWEFDLAELLQRARNAIKGAARARFARPHEQLDLELWLRAEIERRRSRMRPSWDEAPLLPSVLVGVRSWDVTAEGELVAPFIVGEPWPAFEPYVARCLMFSHSLVPGSSLHDWPAPDPGCTCGIYALNRLHPLELTLDVASGKAVGTVSLWGRVVRASRGYRAQYAYPRRLVVPGGRDRAAAVGERYGVPTLAGAELGVDVRDAWPPMQAFLAGDQQALMASRPAQARS